jgi:hypothetical protein
MGGSLKLTVQYPVAVQGYTPEFLGSQAMTRFARAAEAAGSDAIAVTDHPIPSEKWIRSGGHDGFDLTTALAFCGRPGSHQADDIRDGAALSEPLPRREGHVHPGPFVAGPSDPDRRRRKPEVGVRRRRREFRGATRTLRRGNRRDARRLDAPGIATRPALHEHGTDGTAVPCPRGRRSGVDRRGRPAGIHASGQQSDRAGLRC